MKSFLPNKLSKLLKVALKDLDDAKKQGAEVEMLDWYRNTPSGKCTVCLAGATLFNKFELNPFESTWPYHLHKHGLISAHDKQALHAINDLREGDVSNAAKNLFPKMNASELIKFSSLNRQVSDFGIYDTPEWRADMAKLILDLEKADL